MTLETADFMVRIFVNCASFLILVCVFVDYLREKKNRRRDGDSSK